MHFNRNMSNITQLQTNNNYYEIIADIFGYYIISFVGFMGIIFNSFLSYILRSKNLKHSFYKYIFVKAIIDTVVSLFGLVYFKSNCQNCRSRSYAYLIHQWFVVLINVRIAFMMSSISEIYLILNRYLILKNIKNCFYDVKLRYYVPFICGTILLFMPAYFAINIVPDKKTHDELYTWNLNDFGNTTIFKLYTIVMLVPEILIPVITLTVMSILTIRAYNKRIENQAEFMTTSIQHLQKLEKRYTRIAVILTILFVFSRTADAIVAVFMRLYGFFYIEYENSASMLNMFRQLTLFMSFCMHAFSNTFIIIPMDKNLIKLIKKFVKSLKVVVIH